MTSGSPLTCPEGTKRSTLCAPSLGKALHVAGGLCAVALLLLTVHCLPGSPREAANEDTTPEKVEYEMRTFVRSAGDCGSAPAPCAEIRITYPEVTWCCSRTARDNLNEEILGMLLANTYRKGQDKTLDALATAFLEGFSVARRKFQDAASTRRWSIHKTVQVLRNEAGVFSLRLEETADTGGAHPNSAVILRSFRIPEGTRLDLTDLFTSRARAEFHALAERRLREVRGIPSGVSLRDAGFLLGDGELRVGDNFAITEDGLIVAFDPYEIAPYSMGPTELVLTAEELQPLAREGSLLDPGPQN